MTMAMDTIPRMGSQYGGLMVGQSYKAVAGSPSFSSPSGPSTSIMILNPSTTTSTNRRSSHSGSTSSSSSIQPQRQHRLHGFTRGYTRTTPASASNRARSEPLQSNVCGADVDVEMAAPEASAMQSEVGRQTTSGPQVPQRNANLRRMQTHDGVFSSPSHPIQTPLPVSGGNMESGFFGRLKKVLGDLAAAATSSRPSSRSHSPTSGSTDSTLVEQVHPPIVEDSYQQLQEEEQVEDSQISQARSVSPAPTEVDDPDPEYIAETLASHGIEVRDYAYAPRAPRATSTPSTSTSAVATTSSASEADDRVPELFDQYEAVSEFEYRLHQVPRTYPIRGKVLRRLLEVGWVTLEEVRSRCAKMDIEELRRYDGREDGGYPYLVRWKAPKTLAEQLALQFAQFADPKGKGKETDDDDDEDGDYHWNYPFDYDYGDNGEGSSQPRPGVPPPSLRERIDVMMGRRFTWMRMDRARRNAEFARALEEMEEAQAQAVVKAMKERLQRAQEAAKAKKTQQMNQNAKNAIASGSGLNGANRVDVKGKGKAKRPLEDVNEEEGPKRRRMIGGLEFVDEENSQDVYDYDGFVVDVENQLWEEAGAGSSTASSSSSANAGPSNSNGNNNYYFGGLGASNQTNAQSDGDSESEVVIQKQYPAPAFTYDPEVYPGAQEAIQSQEESQGRRRITVEPSTDRMKTPPLRGDTPPVEEPAPGGLGMPNRGLRRTLDRTQTFSQL